MKSVRCSCVCSDGSPCGRRVTDGSNPPICHIHKGHAGFQRKSQTPEQVLDDLMRSKDEAIRLRAADAFLKRQERQTACPRCQAERERDQDREAAVARLTADQRHQIHELIQRVRDILEGN
jgi:hypothetical protein